MDHKKLKKAETLEEALSLFSKDALSANDVLDSFYVDTNKVRYAEATADQIQMMAIAIRNAKTPCHMLFSGHIGSGKSTELRRLEKILAEDNFLVGVAECTSRLNPNTMEYTDVMLFILETLLSCAIENNLEIRRKPLERIKEYWGTDLIKTSLATYEATTGINSVAEIQTPSFLQSIFRIVAGLRAELLIQSNVRNEFQQKVQPDLNVFIAMINDVIFEIQKAGIAKGFRNALPVVLIDSLEKINEEISYKLFKNYSHELIRIQSHIVFTFPISLCYTPEYRQIKNNYAKDWRLPMIKLRIWDGKSYYPYPDGFKILTEIVKKRISDNLFDDNDIKLLIEKTGGSLRDLFEAIYTALLNALGNDRQNIDKKDVNVALNFMMSGISERFPHKMIPKMIAIMNGDKSLVSDEDLITLLRYNAVLEYSVEKLVDLHPLAADWIKKQIYYINSIKTVSSDVGQH